MDLFICDKINIKNEPETGDEIEVVMGECSDKLQDVGNEKDLKNKGFADSHSIECEVGLKNKELGYSDIIERKVYLKDKGFVDTNIVVDNEVIPKIKLVNSHTVQGELHLENKGLLDLNTVKVKTEPGHVDKGNIAVMYSEVEIEYPVVKKECADISYGEEYLSKIRIRKQFSEMGHITPVVGAIESEPETISKEEIPTLPYDAKLQYGIVKQEAEDALVIKFDPGTLKEEEHAHECGTYSEVNFHYPDIKKECFVHLERIAPSLDVVSSKSSINDTKHPIAKKSATKKKSFSCPTCSYKCGLHINLFVHIKTHTGEKPFSCSECTYKCYQKRDLINHARTHTGEKPFSCPDCTYRCSHKSSLVSHVRTHTGEKPFSCSECSFKCYTKSNLVHHTRTHRGEKHNGEKPFSCSECSYKCYLKGNLVRHTRTHSGEKPFSCSECKYRFTRKSHLVNHIRTHTGEKPLSCPKCSYRCSHKNSLVAHIRTHTREKPFSCPQCYYRCKLKNSLVKHVKTHTGK